MPHGEKEPRGSPSNPGSPAEGRAVLDLTGRGSTTRTRSRSGNESTGRYEEPNRGNKFPHTRGEKCGVPPTEIKEKKFCTGEGGPRTFGIRREGGA